jgi:hypothetical protein
MMLLVEAQPRAFCIRGQIVGAGNGEGDGVLLPAIAQIGGEFETRA